MCIDVLSFGLVIDYPVAPPSELAGLKIFNFRKKVKVKSMSISKG